MKRSIIITLIAALIGILSHFIKSDTSPTRYSHTITVEILPLKSGNTVNSTKGGFVSGRHPSTQLQNFNSPENIDKAIDDLNLTDRLDADKATIREQILSNLSVSVEDETGYLLIEYRSDNKKNAEQICNAIVNTYRLMRKELTELTDINSCK